MGDFSLNLLNHGNHLATGEFMDGLYSCTFSPVTLPSRTTSHSATLIDNIFMNHPTHNYLRAGLLLPDVSDHFLVFFICPNSDNEPLGACSKAVFVRDKSSANMDTFLENLQNVNLNRYTDPQQCFSRFVNKYIEIYDKCFPYRKIPPLGNSPVTLIYRVTAVHRFPLNFPGSQLIALLNVPIITQFTFYWQ